MCTGVKGSKIEACRGGVRSRQGEEDYLICSLPGSLTSSLICALTQDGKAAGDSADAPGGPEFVGIRAAAASRPACAKGKGLPFPFF